LKNKARVREFLAELLRSKDDAGEVADSESLFESGRLDSVAAVEVVVFLETEFGLDFSNINFEVALIDSVDQIAALVAEQQA